MRKNFVASGTKTLYEMQQYAKEHFIGPVEAYIIDYRGSIRPTSNWLCANSFNTEELGGYDGGPLTREEKADLYTKGWTVWLEGTWRNRLRDDPMFALMLRDKIIEEPEGWGEGFKI